MPKSEFPDGGWIWIGTYGAFAVVPGHNPNKTFVSWTIKTRWTPKVGGSLWFPHYRAKRAAMRTWLKWNLRLTPVYFISKQRDCDMAQWTSRHKVRNGRQYLKAMTELYQDAEGPVWILAHGKKAYDEFERESRDLALEAFEDGHDWVVSETRWEND